jgi:bifunctional non-homologous end joining protein LigD
MTDWLGKKITPMLAQSGRPFDSNHHLFEIKWDGIRVLAFFGKRGIRLQTRRLLETTHRYPEIVGALEKLPGEGILDGEVVVFDGERPSFERALERELVSDPGKIARRARDIPAFYIAFDLLYWDGRVLMDQPLSERKQLLAKLLTPEPPEPVIESAVVLERGIAYYQQAAERGLEGIMAKTLAGRYLPGQRTRDWIKIKVRRSIDCVVLGTVLERGTGRVKSLVLGAYREGELVWMGNVGSGLDSETLRGLEKELDPLASEPPKNLKVVAPGELRWLKPALVARVEYAETTREGRLRAPVFVGFVNASPEACRAP